MFVNLGSKGRAKRPKKNVSYGRSRLAQLEARDRRQDESARKQPQ
jgi:hypothetical protein